MVIAMVTAAPDGKRKIFLRSEGQLPRAITIVLRKCKVVLFFSKKSDDITESESALFIYEIK